MRMRWAENTKSTFDSESSLGRLGIHRSTTGSETHCISNSPFSTFEFSKPLSVLFFSFCCCLELHHFVSSVNSVKKKQLKGHVSMNILRKSRKGGGQNPPKRTANTSEIPGNVRSGDTESFVGSRARELFVCLVVLAKGVFCLA